MVKFNYIMGTIAIIAGILCALLFNKNIYTVIGSAAGILYGIALIFQASYFERLETDVKQTRTNTVLLYKYLKGEYTEQGPNDPPPVQSEQPAQDQKFSSWKRQK